MDLKSKAKNMKTSEDSIKIILDGLPTGKSSFIRNLRGEPFNQRYEPTEGGGAVPYLLENEENKKLNIILYDTPGQSTIKREWENDIYNEVDCAIFFFQKSNTPSFKYVKKQLKKYKRMKKLAGKEAICVLYATQTNERSKILEEEIMRLTRPTVTYMEGSNKINGSAKNVLLATLRSLYETLRPKDRSPQLDEALFDIFS
jgi:GTPase SAR1 family protein